MKVGTKMSDQPVEATKVIRDNNRDIVNEETVYLIPANNDRDNGIVFNTVEVPVLYKDATEEEEAEATEQALKIMEDEKSSAEDSDLL